MATLARQYERERLNAGYVPIGGGDTADAKDAADDAKAPSKAGDDDDDGRAAKGERDAKRDADAKDAPASARPPPEAFVLFAQPMPLEAPVTSTNLEAIVVSSPWRLADHPASKCRRTVAQR